MRPGRAETLGNDRLFISVTLVVYFVLALGISFLCSMLEAVILSTTTSYIKSLVRAGRPAGRILDDLKHRIDKPLIGILSLNTIANMFGSAGVGAETSRLARAAGVADALPVAIAAGVMTFAILVCSEIIPKTLGATFWRQLAPPSAYALRAMVWALTPLIAVLEFVPRLIASRARPAAVTRDEVVSLAELGRSTGGIPRRESQVIGNLLRLNLMRVHDAMTPRVNLVALPETKTVGAVADDPVLLPHSRIPVFAGSIDEVTGVVLRDDVYRAALSGRRDTTLTQLKRPVRIVPETKSIASMLDDIARFGEHLFLVVNEYGGTEGVITAQDVIDALLGVEITAEMKGVEELRRIAIERMGAERAEKLSRSAPAAPRAAQ